jgi:hypothetical protein
MRLCECTMMSVYAIVAVLGLTLSSVCDASEHRKYELITNATCWTKPFEYFELSAAKSREECQHICDGHVGCDVAFHHLLGLPDSPSECCIMSYFMSCKPGEPPKLNKYGEGWQAWRAIPSIDGPSTNPESN